jgi:hypothetical protein
MIVSENPTLTGQVHFDPEGNGWWTQICNAGGVILDESPPMYWSEREANSALKRRAKALAQMIREVKREPVEVAKGEGKVDADL